MNTTLLRCVVFLVAFLTQPTFAHAKPTQLTKLRLATYNIYELSARKIDEGDDQEGTNKQLRKAAEILQRVRPDVVLINEIDYEAERKSGKANAAQRFHDRYLSRSQNKQKPLSYKYLYHAPVNTGIPTGKDLDNDGKTDGPADAFGFGKYPGQYGMALYSRFPIDRTAVRTFRLLLWKKMPRNVMPDGKRGKPAYYSSDEVDIFRLSSKSHWDVPVKIAGQTLHLLCCHPTPPIFDGKEDSNGRRNFDELRLWVDYITGGKQASYIQDDRGRKGGLSPKALFVLLGDLNADPVRADKSYGPHAIEQLLKHPRVQDPKPRSAGATLEGNPDIPKASRGSKTAWFGRVDYVLPCRKLTVLGSGVFWPGPKDPQRHLIEAPNRSSDHRLVWVDLALSRSKTAK